VEKEHILIYNITGIYFIKYIIQEVKVNEKD